MALSKNWRNALASTATVLLAAGLIAVGAWGFFKRHRATHNPRPIIPAATVTRSTDAPDETPPADACQDHQAAAHQPRRIELPSIGAAGCVQKVGIDQHNAVAAPTNIHLAGWYVRSAAPGQKGVSIIDGHVRGKYSDGIFSKLGRLRPGDHIKIQLGDKSWRQFSVLSTGTYPVDQASTELFRQLEHSDKQLTLITCGGAYNPDTKTYDKRVVVRAQLL